MKRTITLILALALTMALAGCGGGQKPAADTDDQGAAAEAGKSLYEHGMDLISMMEEMAESDAYVALYSASSELKEIVSRAAEGDYSEPKEVYEITVPTEMVTAMAEVVNIDGLSDRLKDHVVSKAHGAIPVQINAAGGANMLAASSICTVGKTFVSPELTGNTIYLYTFESGVPVAVTFTPGEDGAASATSCFIFYDGYDYSSAETIQEQLAEISATVGVLER